MSSKIQMKNKDILLSKLVQLKNQPSERGVAGTLMLQGLELAAPSALRFCTENTGQDEMGTGEAENEG